MAHPRRLGKDPLYNISKRVGAYEVSGLKYLGPEVNQLLSASDFAKEFNAVPGHAMWTINHYSTTEHQNLGYLMLERDGGPTLGIGVDHFGVQLPYPTDRLFLIACKGSFLLFRVFPTLRLLIINLTNGEVRLTPPVPHQAREGIFFGEKNNTQMILSNFGFNYTVIHGHYTNGRFTTVAYTYHPDEWYMDRPEPVNTLQGCDLNDPRSMVFTYLEEDRSVFVSVRNGLVVYLLVPILPMIPPHFRYLFEQNNICVPSRLGQGWLVVLQRFSHGWVINLFKLNVNYQVYEHKSLAPLFRHTNVLLQQVNVGAYHLEETEAVVAFSMSLSWQGLWGFLIFRYNTLEDGWDFMFQCPCVTAILATSSPFRTTMHLVPTLGRR